MVDDNPADSEFTAELLEEADETLQISILSKPEDVLSLAQSSPELIPSVLVVDVNLPRMSGFELLEILHALTCVDERQSAFEVYMLSGSESTSDRRRAEENPLVVDYLTKPLTPECAQTVVCAAASKAVSLESGVIAER